MSAGDDDVVASDGRFRPGDDTLPTHTMEFLRIEGNDALIKYVPGEYVPRGALPAELPEDESAPGIRPRTRNRRPTPIHALLGILFWAATVVLTAVGMNLALGGDYATSQVIAFIAAGCSVLGFILGGIAVLLRRGDGLGIVAMVLCLVSNPLLLAKVLGWLSELTP
ncbi:hypothetical protein B0I08_108118 [Glaciihabitans tibetensis]|uniref:Uncharacterized protein n=1 Tax=Glaciihabitans tibetensis TaxID=1266600 RepID=A0A2T0VA58_9MICO|nr:hypothetical protein [Glaciihabitans tibetensis]PRY67034.1 hypothetical protein B0I08_108118 [Glaciihabitans tibetensis]